MAPKRGLVVYSQEAKGLCLFGSFRPQTFQKISFTLIEKWEEDPPKEWSDPEYQKEKQAEEKKKELMGLFCERKKSQRAKEEQKDWG